MAKRRKRTNGDRTAAVRCYACTVRVRVEMRLLRHGRTVLSGLRSVDPSQDGPTPDNGRRMTPWPTGSRRGGRTRATVGGAAEQQHGVGWDGLGLYLRKGRSLVRSWAIGILAQLSSLSFLLYIYLRLMTYLLQLSLNWIF